MKKGLGRPVLWALTAAAAAWTLAGGLPARPAETAIRPSSVWARSSAAVLDVNAATASQLDELPGIGPALAGRILAAREENGPFAGPEDILAVSGIGPAVWEDMAPFVYFGGGEPTGD